MSQGLSAAEALAKLKEFGPNAIPEKRPHPLRSFLMKLWGPVPWMLEISLGLELFIGRYTQATIIGLLLLFNALISFFQERKAQNALALLQSRLTVKAKVLRDGVWETLPAQEVVPGDVIHLRMGDFVPADVRLLEGNISIDQSALTGESLPAECGPGNTAYAGGVVQRGEATGEVSATGLRTYYGKTAELVQTAKTASHLEATIMKIVRVLVALDSLLVLGVLVYSVWKATPLSESIPFALMLLIASVPVALPATFTLASALGARELAHNGVLVTRLSAIEEAAAMDVLCSDKTGTITQNMLTLSGMAPNPPFTEKELLLYAVWSSMEASQDPIDLAILKAAQGRVSLDADWQRVDFTPFDPLTKRTEAVVQHDGVTERIVKGAPQAIARLVPLPSDQEAAVERLAGEGHRVLAVAAGTQSGIRLVGLLGFYDPPRLDSRNLILALKELGVRVVMVTGDGLATARAIAAQVGLGQVACPAEVIRQEDGKDRLSCDVIAEVLPEDKFHLVQAFQQAGHVVGMTGDGVNDAPALKQAEVGIAVSSATDVAKAAASIVLTNPGLSDVLAAVTIGRQIYQRMLTYTLNKIIKTFQIGLFLSLGLIVAGIFVVTPRLVILLLFANDFVTMSLASDQVGYSRKPDRWPFRSLVVSALVIAGAWLIFAFGTLFLGLHVYHLSVSQLQTYMFAMLVFSGQANVYLVRERGHFWGSRPGSALVWSSVGDLLIVTLLTTQGILMTPIAFYLISSLFGLTIVYMAGMDFLKFYVFRKLGLN